MVALVSVAFAQPIERYEDWRLELSVDPFTDENNGAIYTYPVDYPEYGDGDIFGLLCADGHGVVDGVAAMLIGSAYISGRTTSVIYRVDSDAPVTQKWEAGDKTIFVPESELKSFLPALLSGTRLAIRYDAYSSSPTYIYSLAGLREAIQELDCYKGHL